jgi:excisionase family DNA binding protein
MTNSSVFGDRYDPPAAPLCDHGKAVDELLTSHVTRALVMHRRWCRSRGHRFPRVLDVILGALTATTGPEWPPFAETLDSAESNHVPPSPLLLTDSDAAWQLGVSARTVRRLRTEGTLPVVLVGRRRFVRPEDLAAFVANGGEQ